jgi:hypothetical protein
MKIRWLSGAIACAFISFGLFPGDRLAQGGVIYTSFGAGNAYDTNLNNAFVIAGASSAFGATFTGGSSFVASTTATVDHVDLAVRTSSIFGSDGNFSVQLWTSTGSGSGLAIGTMLGSYSATAPSTATVLTVATPNHPTLTAGQTYFLIAVPADANSFVGWFANNQSLTGQIYESQNGTVDYRNFTLTAFDVISPAVGIPEPSLACLSLIALGAAGSLRRLSRKPRAAARR